MSMNGFIHEFFKDVSILGLRPQKPCSYSCPGLGLSATLWTQSTGSLIKHMRFSLPFLFSIFLLPRFLARGKHDADYLIWNKRITDYLLRISGSTNLSLICQSRSLVKDINKSISHWESIKQSRIFASFNFHISIWARLKLCCNCI